MKTYLTFDVGGSAIKYALIQEDLSILPNLTIDDAQEMKSLGVTLVLVDEAPTEQQTAALQAQGIQVLVISPAKSRDDCNLYLIGYIWDL